MGFFAFEDKHLADKYLYGKAPVSKSTLKILANEVYPELDPGFQLF